MQEEVPKEEEDKKVNQMAQQRGHRKSKKSEILSLTRAESSGCD